MNIISPTYASMVKVPVPVKVDEKVDFHPSVQKVNKSIPQLYKL